MTAWTLGKAGVTVVVRVTPRAARDAIEGIVTADDGRSALVVRLTAAPADGAANDALIRLLAKGLGVPRRDIALASGATSRLKRLDIMGDPADLAARLETIARERHAR